MMPEPVAVLHEAPAFYFDGRRNTRRLVTIRFLDALEITGDGVFVAAWPYAAIRRVDRYPDGLRLLAKGTAELSRLEIKDADSEVLILERCRWINEFDPHLPTILRRIVLPLMLVAALLLVAIFFGIPYLGDRVARATPDTIDMASGRLFASAFEAKAKALRCDAPAGLDALQHLVTTLHRASGVSIKPKLTIVSDPQDNALTLAGGLIVVYDGILRKAKTPDEFAGIVAHEMGHMAHRDFFRGLTAMTLEPVLLGLTFGDVTAAGLATKQTNGLIHGYTGRGIEFAADRYGAELLRSLGRPPSALADILLRLADSGKGFEGLYADHPIGMDRAEAIGQIAPPAIEGPDLLSQTEWDALKAICDHG
jgi:Zn-dependent protease with chaperone function